MFWHWLDHVTGSDYGLPYGHFGFYNFWSGFGSDLTEFGLAVSLSGVLLTLFRKHNCHTRWCWRIGHHDLEGTPWKVCRRHHPDLPNKAPTYAEIVQAHKEAQQ
jgi:hypothetical protein